MIRKATIDDVKAIQELINYYAKEGKMLPRALNELYENIRDFFIYEEDGRISGCCALNTTWENLAEVRSLAVKQGADRKGIGSLLVKSVLDDAKKLKVKKVFALTYVPEFFEKMGFKRIDHSELPHKIWSECIKCVKFPDCAEIALEINI